MTCTDEILLFLAAEKRMSGPLGWKQKSHPDYGESVKVVTCPSMPELAGQIRLTAHKSRLPPKYGFHLVLGSDRDGAVSKQERMKTMRDGYSVTVYRNSCQLVTIESAMLSGCDLTPDDVAAIRTAGEHLLAFAGPERTACFICGGMEACAADCELIDMRPAKPNE